MKDHKQYAESLLGEPFAGMDEVHKKVVHHVADRKHISRDIDAETNEQSTFGQRAADAVASFGGSWTFIGSFAVTLITWVVLNSYVLAHVNETFDPFPYILLNLFLSMLASVQAPLILMSQNRQAQKDRINARHDYEVNLKSELEIMLLHEKLDHLRERQWAELLAIQAEQTKLLTALIEKHHVTDRQSKQAPLHAPTS